MCRPNANPSFLCFTVPVLGVLLLLASLLILLLGNASHSPAAFHVSSSPNTPYDTIQTLSNTVYLEDTTWTSNTTYSLIGSVTVSQGVTLTVQPGTEIKAGPDGVLDVAGTIVAQGTYSQPIVFSLGTGDGPQWIGIRFAQSATDAVFDSSGRYVVGSILSNVEISGAQIGLDLAGRSPYVTKSRFLNNGIGIKTWAAFESTSRIHIEDSYFFDNGIESNGGETIKGNRFEHFVSPYTGCSIDLHGGSPLIIQNSFSEALCAIKGWAWYPAIISNTIYGSTDNSIDVTIVPQDHIDQAPRPELLGIPKVLGVGAFENHTCTWRDDDSMQCWGSNSNGELGNSRVESANVPLLVRTFHGAATQLAGGHSHTCALLDDGSVQCWGNNRSGQLGNSDDSDSPTPKAVTGLVDKVAQITAGSFHTCALLVNGAVQCWGRNSAGQLGTGNFDDGTYTPQLVQGLAGSAIQITAGRQHTCAVLADGTSQCWGSNNFGQLGNGTFDNASLPQRVVGLTDAAIALTAGGTHTCALLDGGEVQCWGSNTYGQLGNSNNAWQNSTPQRVDALSDTVTQLVTGSEHTCAMLADESVQCWGMWPGSGSSDEATYIPTTIVGLEGNAAQVSAGGSHTCVLLENRTLQCWGANTSGELGCGHNRTTQVVQQVVDANLYLYGNTVQHSQHINVSIVAISDEIEVIRNYVSHSSSGIGVGCGGCRARIKYNTLVNNDSFGLAVGNNGGSLTTEAFTIEQNNLAYNGHYDLYLAEGNPGTQNFVLSARRNFWGAAAFDLPSRIHDCSDTYEGCGSASAIVGRVEYEPILAFPASQTPKFTTLQVFLPLISR